MLDTCICSFIMREHPAAVIQRLTAEVEQGNQIVISAITYAEMRYGQIGKKASTNAHAELKPARPMPLFKSVAAIGWISSIVKVPKFSCNLPRHAH